MEAGADEAPARQGGRAKFVAGIGAAVTDGRGAPANSPRLASGGESSTGAIAECVLDAVATGRKLLLPDNTARKAWWLSRLAPELYARIMKRRVGGEFAGLV